MPNLMLSLFNRGAASPANKPGEVLASLPLQTGACVADIGSGGGYYTVQFARKVGPDGRVYAVDTVAKNLDYVRRQAEKAGLQNVTTVLSGDGSLDIPTHSLDLVFLRDVFHHLPDPAAYFSRLKQYLRPNARVAVIDYRKRRGLDFTTLTGHYTEEEVILDKMERAGYERVQELPLLPRQSFNLFAARE